MESENNTDKIETESVAMEKELADLRKKVRSLSRKVTALEKKLNADNSMTNCCVEEEKEPVKKPKKFLWVGEVVFYIVLILIILGAFFIRNASDGKPTSFAGFSMFTVLTSSMESEIPKGSLVITKQVSPEKLKIGDDITYLVSETTTITHRIIGITERYQNTGSRAFETQGINNAKPDKDLVPAANVVGKVVFHSETFGIVAKFISENWPFMIFVLVVLFLFIAFMKKILKEDKKGTIEKPKKKKEKSIFKKKDKLDANKEIEERK